VRPERLAAALIGFVLATVACASPAAVVRVSLSSDIRSTDPGVNRDANTDTVMMHIVEGLVAYRENGTVGPMLAQSISISPDGTVYTFRLRSGVRFQNGAPLTASDVVWTWRHYLNPRTGWSCLAQFDGSEGDRIDSIVATDPHTVVFRLNRPQPLFLVKMAAIQCGQSGILHPSSVSADGSWRAPVGTGPYMLGAWKRGEYVELDAFKGYKPLAGPRDGNTGAKIPYASKIIWLIIPDAASRVAALANGQIEIMPEVSASEMLQLKHIQGVAVSSAPMLETYGILIQAHDPLLADVRLRRALALSLDRKAIAALVTNGTGVPDSSIIPASSPYHSSAESMGDGYDLAAARRLLASAHYHGQPIVMMTNRRYPYMFNQALLVQAMAREAGINIRLQVVEWAEQMAHWLSGKYQLMSFGFSARADPSLSYAAILGNPELNHSLIWSDPDAIRLAANAERTTDPAARQRLFDQLYALMIRDCPMIVLFSPADVDAVGGGIHGFSPWAFGRARLWGVWRASPSTPNIFSTPGSVN